MKNSRFGKLIAVVLSLAVVLGAGAMIMAMADDATESAPVTTAEVGIASMNVVYDAQTEMLFAVRDDRAQQNGELYLLLLKNKPEDGAAGDKLYETAYQRKTAAMTLTAAEFYELQDKECPEGLENSSYHIFYSGGINASEIGQTQYAVPVVVSNSGHNTPITYEIGYTLRDGDNLSYTARPVSVANYAVQQIAEGMETLPEEHKELYLTILEYGYSAAQARWGDKADDNFVITTSDDYFIVMDGCIGKNANGFHTVYEKNPESVDVFLRAEAKNPEGKYFLYWADLLGRPVSYDRVIDKAPKVRDDTSLVAYIAVYGESSESYYSLTPDFESEESKLITDKNTTSYTIGNFRAKGNSDKVGDTKIGINSWIKGEDGGDKHYVFERENVDGTKIGHGGRGTTLDNTGVKGANVFEVDFAISKVHSYTQVGRFVLYGENFTFGFLFEIEKNGDSNKVKFKPWNTSLAGEQSSVYYDSDGTISAGVTSEDGKTTYYPTVKTYDYPTLGEFITIKAMVDTKGDVPVAYIYVNNELFVTAAGALEGQSNYKYGGFSSIGSEYAAGCDATINQIGIFINQYNFNRYEFDNVTIRRAFSGEFDND